MEIEMYSSASIKRSLENFPKVLALTALPRAEGGRQGGVEVARQPTAQHPRRSWSLPPRRPAGVEVRDTV